MFEGIFEYIDMLLEMVKPTKVLYMAVDGVAPRAKMNQQRSRRFRAAKESKEKKITLEQIKDELRMKGVEFEEKVERAHFDSNVITPGTPFMMNLGKALRDWIDSKMANAIDDTFLREEANRKELRWPKDLIVFLSDASVPGEGEHKIIDFVRKQKAQSNYNPNLRHCLCGADADLIMLGLATHELDFTILREEFIPNQPKPCELCAQFGHETKECQGKASIPDVNYLLKATSTPFIYIRLCVLREYLEKECDDLDFERFIDDWVLLFFFVGNDFLPHLPSLEIREGAIDKLLRIYKQMMSQYSHPKPYITNNGYVSLHKVQMILAEFGKMEDEIFVRRKINEEKYKMRLKRQKMLDHKSMNSEWLAPVPLVKRGEEPERLDNVKQEAANLLKESTSKLDETSNEEDKNKLDSTTTEDNAASIAKQIVKRKIDESLKEDSLMEQELEDEKSDNEGDDVQLWNEGWKERYYLHKFDCKDHNKVSQIIAENYAIGLCWVMRYYYQGCQDWQWYFPYHYAPFASDFKNIANIKVKFNTDARPFKPLEQLMSVFPAASCDSLPPTWQQLMKSDKSNIVDFYPHDFKVDLNGKKQAWQGVALLPFIDESRLFRTLEQVYPELTASEVDRNQLGENLIFISKLNESCTSELSSAFEENGEEAKLDSSKFKLHNLQGELRKSKRFSDEIGNGFCLEFFDPTYEKNFVFKAKRLPNAKLPERILKPEDFKNKNYYNNNNNNQHNRNQFNHHQQQQQQQQQQQNNQFYRPVIGFTRNNQQQASLGNAGHRMLDFYNRQNYSNNSNLNSNQTNYQSTGYQTNNYQQQRNNYQQRNQQPNYSQLNQQQQIDYSQAQTNYQQQPQASYQAQASYQQSPFQLNYPQQTINQPNYINPNYLRRDNLSTNVNLSANAQDFIPSYQTAANPANQANRFNNRPNQNRQNRNNRN